MGTHGTEEHIIISGPEGLYDYLPFYVGIFICLEVEPVAIGQNICSHNHKEINSVTNWMYTLFPKKGEWHFETKYLLNK